MSSYSGELTALQPDFEELGRREAAEHKPPSNASSPDHNEVALRLRAEGLLNAEQGRADAAAVEGTTTYLQLRHKLVEFDHRAQELLNEGSAPAVVIATLAERRSELIAVCVAKLRAQVAWRAFREKHRISEEARYPDSKIMHFAWLSACALVETLINAFFFENSQGLLGGFVVALGVSILNIGTAAFLGIGYRYKNLTSGSDRAIGWACLALFIVLSIFCNALFAAFRSEYQLVADPNDAFQLRNAFGTAIAEAPRIFMLDMQMADFMSFILFGVGLILSGIAFWKGYTSDDKHPGYSHLDRDRKISEALEVERRSAALQDVKTFLQQRRLDVSSAIAEPARIGSQISSLEATLGSARSLLELNSASIQRDYELILGTYRRANSAVRGTPAPPHFSIVENLMARVQKLAVESTLVQVTGLRDELEAVHLRLQPLLRSRLDALNEQAAHAISETYSDFVRSVESESWQGLDASVVGMSRATRG